MYPILPFIQKAIAENRDLVVLDPCCGSGVLLHELYSYLSDFTVARQYQVFSKSKKEVFSRWVCMYVCMFVGDKKMMTIIEWKCMQ